MPTKASRARKWIASGRALPRRTKEGVFYVQLNDDPSGCEKQCMVLAIDPGSKYDGYCVAGKAEVALMGMAVLPKLVHRRMSDRRDLRRGRRSRNCRRREARFNNRGVRKGWIAPSQLSKVQLRTRIMERACSIFPISDIVIEDVRFNHYKKRWGRHFSAAEIGKTILYKRAGELAHLWLCEGWETADMREAFGIKKGHDKGKLAPESHANDALAMSCWFGTVKPEGSPSEFYVWRRQECSRRRLHLSQPSVGGMRKRYGGTTNPDSSLRKGDVISYRDSDTGYVGGWRDNGKAISFIGSDGKRILQAGVGTIRLLQRSPNILAEVVSIT